jgi:hypothetical protein
VAKKLFSKVGELQGKTYRHNGPAVYQEISLGLNIHPMHFKISGMELCHIISLLLLTETELITFPQTNHTDVFCLHLVPNAVHVTAVGGATVTFTNVLTVLS